MLPEFPKFKNLEIADKDDVQKITNQFPPYSDFNFTSMWSWDVKRQMKISKLHGNLVVRFTDYLTMEPFYSFIGKNKVSETIRQILDLCKKEGLKAQLKLVPEDSIKEVEKKLFNIEENRDDFDYIYEVENLIRMPGQKFATQRRHHRFFGKTFHPETKQLNVNEPMVKKNILNLFNDWAMDKKGKVSVEFLQNEYFALTNFLSASDSINFLALGIFVENNFVGVSLMEQISDTYGLGHFQKTRTSLFKGINEYLALQEANLLHSKNIKYLNCEQDLGIPGLRLHKESYMPCKYLKKFLVRDNL